MHITGKRLNRLRSRERLERYIFGFQSVQDPTYSQDDKLKSKLNENETQTNSKLSETDKTKNYHFDNTFSKGKYGSTDTILTFGFSGNKIADYLDDKNSCRR